MQAELLSTYGVELLPIEQLSRGLRATGRSPTPGDAFLSHLLELAGVENVFAGDKGVSIVILPAQLEAKKADRVLDVSQAMVDRAWVDPVGTAQALRNAAGGAS